MQESHRYKDLVVRHEEKFGRNLDLRRLFNFHVRLTGGKKRKAASADSNDNKRHKAKDSLESWLNDDDLSPTYGCLPNEWGKQLRNVEHLYDSLSDEIKNKKVMIDFVKPDPGEDTDYDVVRKEFSLKEMVGALFARTKNDEGEFPETMPHMGFRRAISVDSPCWWFGKVKDIVEALLEGS